MSHNNDGHWRESRWNQTLREIRRLPSEGVCAGVLAGIGDYMGWNHASCGCWPCCCSSS